MISLVIKGAKERPVRASMVARTPALALETSVGQSCSGCPFCRRWPTGTRAMMASRSAGAAEGSTREGTWMYWW